MQPNKFITESLGFPITIHTNFFVTPKLDAESGVLQEDPTYFYTNDSYKESIQIDHHDDIYTDDIYRELNLLNQALKLFTTPRAHVESKHVNYLYRRMLLSPIQFQKHIHLTMIDSNVLISFIHPITGYIFEIEVPQKYFDSYLPDTITNFNDDKIKHLNDLLDKLKLNNFSTFKWTDKS